MPADKHSAALRVIEPRQQAAYCGLAVARFVAELPHGAAVAVRQQYCALIFK